MGRQVKNYLAFEDDPNLGLKDNRALKITYFAKP